jgi:DNA-directed RNA polymerase subunit beta
MNESLKKTVLRATFGKIHDLHTLPDLLEVQKESYEKLFLQDPHTQRSFIDEIFHKLFPIKNSTGTCSIEYVDLVVDEPVYTESLCLNSSLNYTHKLYAQFKITNSRKDQGPGSTQLYKAVIGEIPRMTSNGTFIINGLEKVCVMQLARAPGLVFCREKDVQTQKYHYIGRLVPERGSWLEVMNERNILYARIDKRRKFPVTMMLLALGYTPESILEMFYTKLSVSITYNDLGVAQLTVDREKIQAGNVLPFDIVHEGAIVVRNNQVVTPDNLQYLIEHDVEITCDVAAILTTRLLSPLDLGEHVFAVNQEINLDMVNVISTHKVKHLDLATETRVAGGYEIAHTLQESVVQGAQDQLSALVIIAHIIKGAELVANIMDDRDHAQLLNMYEKVFFRSDTYSLSPTGRFKLNYKLGRLSHEDHLTANDLVEMLRYFLEVLYQEKRPDNADSLDNKRIKTVKEHLGTIITSGLHKAVQQTLEIINRPSSNTNKTGVGFDGIWKGADILNIRHVGLTIREFFKQNPIVQFLEKENELAQLSHKRRVTALGPGGVGRTWAGVDVRDIDFTKYGRICPVETPEGLNIGLINSLTRHASLDKYGFLNTPFVKVVNRKCTNEVVYFNSLEEHNYKIAPRGTALTNELELLPGLITCRYRHEVQQLDSLEIEYMDIAANQALSASASLIPFIERNDTKRALMGANMQRQAVPLLIKQFPLLGTGMERRIAQDSKAFIRAHRNGEVVEITTNAVILSHTNILGETELDIYPIRSFNSAKKKSSMNDRLCVRIGDKVEAGDIILEGTCSSDGELSLGTNLKIAYVSLDGYNFEDSIIISDNLLQEETLNSIHVHELTCNVHETPLGDEEITADIPNVKTESLNMLDSRGIIGIGTEVKTGDILVGKVTPKAEDESTPEDRLLKAIFGDKISNVTDSSMRVPNHIAGTVIDVSIVKLQQEDNSEVHINSALLFHESNIYFYLDNRLLPGKFRLIAQESALEENYQTLELIVRETHPQLAPILKQVSVYRDTRNKLKHVQPKHVFANNVLEQVTIKIAAQNIIQQGDKITSRHGNKGTVSKVFKAVDMPYMEDGSSVDLIFTPLGIPSRMNLGQLFEANLGLISQHLGMQVQRLLSSNCTHHTLRDLLDKIYNKLLKSNFDFSQFSEKELFTLASSITSGVPMSCPGFEIMDYKEIEELMTLCGFEKSGNFQLYDGRTGRPFARKSCVGVIYCLKLDHMVENKVHARATGPYSLITKQPLGGRSHFGGQRVGEMECWALEGYGASYLLHEMLTVKSDDIEGRNEMYKNIFAGIHDLPATCAPESYRIIKSELRALGFNLEEIYLDPQKEQLTSLPPAVSNPQPNNDQQKVYEEVDQDE